MTEALAKRDRMGRGVRARASFWGGVGPAGACSSGAEPGGGVGSHGSGVEANPYADFAMGGQAVIEGVMMRGPRAYAVAVRRPQGDIVLRRRSFLPVTKRKKWLRLPVVRGAVSLSRSEPATWKESPSLIRSVIAPSLS